MAYGVKYRLIFSDILGNQKKLEILKNNYSGSVNSIIGTNNPIVIQWENDNDFYNPIIGSNCTINLKVTDDVQYDDFYKFDEKEYLVKVFYKDAGNTFQLYWQGYIVTDTYKQVFTAPPYDIQLKAFDLLGSLDAFDVVLTAGDSVRPLRSTSDPHDPTSSVPTKTLAQNITDCLANTGLAMSLYVSLNIDSNNILDQIEGNGVFKFNKNFDIVNCKEYLSNILKCLNARLFQSFGRWYIINNSTYMDKYNIDNYATIGSDRRLAATKHLQANHSETINYKVYTSSGSISTPNLFDAVLIDLKRDTTPLNNDLTVEYLPAARKIEHEVSREMETILNNELVLDPGFEITSSDTNDILWDDSAESASYQGTIGVYNIVNGGVRAVRTSTFTTDDPVSPSTVVESKNTFIGALSGIKNQPPDLDPDETITLTFKVYLDGTMVDGEKVTFKYVLYRIKSDTESYNPSTETWTSGTTIIEHEITEANKWVNFSLNFKPSSSVEEYIVNIRTPKKGTSSSFNFMYIDNVTIRRAFKLDNLLFERSLNNNSNIIKQKYEGIVQDYNNYAGIVGNVASATQEQLNDFRTFLPRYEGLFYNKNINPISLHNKLWINYATVFVEGTSSGSNAKIIDNDDGSHTTACSTISDIDTLAELNTTLSSDDINAIHSSDIGYEFDYNFAASVEGNSDRFAVAYFKDGKIYRVSMTVDDDNNLLSSVQSCTNGITTITETVTGTRIYTDSTTTDISVGDYVYGYRDATNPITSALKVTSIESNYIQLDGSITYVAGEHFGFSKANLYNFGVSPDYHLHEPVPCIIDALEYNVKQNTVKVVMHVPNQDDNVSNTQITRNKI